jgi:hypothetical protein
VLRSSRRICKVESPGIALFRYEQKRPAPHGIISHDSGTVRSVGHRGLPVTGRRVFTSHPPSGDYILNPTGFTWGIRRACNNGNAVIISAGERSRTVAVAAILSLAGGDKVDAWEPVGNTDFRLIKRYRS